MAEGIPEGWRSLGVSILFGIFAFAFGFEAVVNFNDWLLGQGPSYLAVSIADAAVCLVLSAVALIAWKGREILPAKVIHSLSTVANNGFVWLGSLLAIFIILAMPNFITHIGLPSSPILGTVPSASEIASQVANGEYVATTAQQGANTIVEWDTARIGLSWISNSGLVPGAGVFVTVPKSILINYFTVYAKNTSSVVKTIKDAYIISSDGRHRIETQVAIPPETPSGIGSGASLSPNDTMLIIANYKLPEDDFLPTWGNGFTMVVTVNDRREERDFDKQWIIEQFSKFRKNAK